MDYTSEPCAWDFGFTDGVCSHCLSFGPCKPLVVMRNHHLLELFARESWDPTAEDVFIKTLTLTLCPCCLSHAKPDGSVELV